MVDTDEISTTVAGAANAEAEEIATESAQSATEFALSDAWMRLLVLLVQLRLSGACFSGRAIASAMAMAIVGAC